jgi:adenylate cyclase
VKAALGMRKSLKRLNLKREAQGKPPLSIGIGINYGPAVAGNMGSEEKMEYTVLGDSVNLTSRIESMTKELKTDLLVSKSIVDALDGKYPFENCGNFHVKGKTQEVALYKIPDAEEAKDQERPAA